MTIWWAKTLTSKDQLHVGQVLRIPLVDGVLYTAKEGDTVAAVAARFHADPAAVTTYNGLATDELTLGQQVMIPNGVGSSIVVPAHRRPSTADGQRRPVAARPVAPAAGSRRSPGRCRAGTSASRFGCTGFPYEPASATARTTTTASTSRRRPARPSWPPRPARSPSPAGGTTTAATRSRSATATTTTPATTTCRPCLCTPASTWARPADRARGLDRPLHGPASAVRGVDRAHPGRRHGRSTRSTTSEAPVPSPLVEGVAVDRRTETGGYEVRHLARERVAFQGHLGEERLAVQCHLEAPPAARPQRRPGDPWRPSAE